MLDARSSVFARQIVIPASPEHLWEALTDPDRLVAWFGSRVEWDLRPGGAARFLDEDGSIRRGVVDAVFPGRHLSFTWWPESDGDGEASQVTYTLEPEKSDDEAEGTRLTVTEQPVALAVGPMTAGPPASGRGWTEWDTRLFRCSASGAGRARLVASGAGRARGR